MTTPTTMTTSVIATATTMMTDVVVAPSCGGLLVGCVLLLTGAVPVVVIAPLVWGLLVGCVLLLLSGTISVVVIVPLLWIGEDTPTVWEVVGTDPVERKYTRCHFTWIETQSTEIWK